MISHASRAFLLPEACIHTQKESVQWYMLYADFVFVTEQFREFQMTVVEEALAQINDALNADDMVFEDVAHTFETILQDANERLIAFADKMTAVELFDIRWMILLSHHNSFVSAVIGDVSMVLARGWRVWYTMQNDTDKRQKISLFSDIVEGDIGRDDVVYFFGAHISSIMDREEMDDIVSNSVGKSYPEMLELWMQDIHTRVTQADLAVISQYMVDVTSVRGLKSRPSFVFPEWITNLWDRVLHILDITVLRLGQKIRNKEFLVLGIMAWLFLLFVLWSIVHWWIKNNATQSIKSDWTVTASLSIEDIKKGIADFQKLDPSSDEKIVKYNTLLKELQRIQSEGKRANDVTQLKKILDTEYLQWFNVVVFDNLQEQMVYQFSSLENATLGKPLQVFYNKGLYIAGSQWAMLAGLSNDIRWTVVRSEIDKVKQCSIDIPKTWLYCISEKNALIHLTKSGADPMWGDGIVFPGSIVWLATFGSSNFYVLTQDPSYTKDNTYLVKYTSTLWAQNSFANANPLPIVWSTVVSFTQWVSSLSVDGTFLLWDKSKKALYQLYRAPQAKALSARVVPLQGWLKLWKGLSDDIKVMTSAGSRYVYFYDRNNHTLSTYISNPAKNSDVYSTAYGLEYVMRLDFSKLSTLPYDVTVDESDGKQNAYVLTDAWVAKVSMSDLLETLKSTKDQFKR